MCGKLLFFILFLINAKVVAQNRIQFYEVAALEDYLFQTPLPLNPLDVEYGGEPTQSHPLAWERQPAHAFFVNESYSGLLVKKTRTTPKGTWVESHEYGKDGCLMNARLDVLKNGVRLTRFDNKFFYARDRSLVTVVSVLDKAWDTVGEYKYDREHRLEKATLFPKNSKGILSVCYAYKYDSWFLTDVSELYSTKDGAREQPVCALVYKSAAGKRIDFHEPTVHTDGFFYSGHYTTRDGSIYLVDSERSKILLDNSKYEASFFSRPRKATLDKSSLTYESTGWRLYATWNDKKLDQLKIEKVEYQQEFLVVVALHCDWEAKEVLRIRFYENGLLKQEGTVVYKSGRPQELRLGTYRETISYNKINK